MATILQCKFCNAPFQSLGGKLCLNCLDQVDLDFVTIRDYIYDNPGVFDIDNICEATAVKKKTVLYLIEQKRLIIDAPEGHGAFSCSMCHKPIPEGKICDDCKQLLSAKLGSTLPKQDTKKPLTTSRSNARMHTRIDRDKDS